METLGHLIATRREELNLSQEQVAIAAGVTRATVCRWEKGNISNIKSDKLAGLAKILRLDPRQLVNPSPAQPGAVNITTGNISVNNGSVNINSSQLFDRYNALPENTRQIVEQIMLQVMDSLSGGKP